MIEALPCRQTSRKRNLRSKFCTTPTWIEGVSLEGKAAMAVGLDVDQPSVGLLLDCASQPYARGLSAAPTDSISVAAACPTTCVKPPVLIFLLNDSSVETRQADLVDTLDWRVDAEQQNRNCSQSFTLVHDAVPS
jgi:hypothetical protein